MLYSKVYVETTIYIIMQSSDPAGPDSVVDLPLFLPLSLLEKKLLSLMLAVEDFIGVFLLVLNVGACKCWLTLLLFFLGLWEETVCSTCGV